MVIGFVYLDLKNKKNPMQTIHYKMFEIALRLTKTYRIQESRKFIFV